MTNLVQTTTAAINNYLPQLEIPQQDNPWVVGILSSMIAGGLLITMLAVSKQLYAGFLGKIEMDTLKRHLLLGRLSTSTTTVSEVLPFDIKEALRTYDGTNGEFVDQLLRDKQFGQENPDLCNELWEGTNDTEGERFCKNNKRFRADVFKKQLAELYKLNMVQRIISAVFHAIGGASVNISFFTCQPNNNQPQPAKESQQ